MDILILEPNKIYSSLMKANLEKYLFFTKCDVIESFRELKEADKEYDLYITSDVLVDSEKEHLEYLKDKKFILATNSDKIDENAIDYIRKSDVSIINYLIKLVKRIHNNKYMNVLLVEYNDDSRNYKKKILEKMNLNVVDTSYAREALRIIKQQKIHLIIIEAKNRDLDIVKFVKSVRKDFKFDELAIVIVSDVEDMEKTIDALKYGATTYIQKPYFQNGFLIRINNVLDSIPLDLNDKEFFIDSLTNTYNGFYLDVLENIFKTYYQKSIAILKFDDFNKIKKKSGYKTANKKLIEFVEGIKKIIRKNDILVRIYKDTFLLFMPNTTKKDADVVISKIKALNFNFSASTSDDIDTLAESLKVGYDKIK